jgi:hypothetical protein
VHQTAPPVVRLPHGALVAGGEGPAQRQVRVVGGAAQQRQRHAVTGSARP